MRSVLILALVLGFTTAWDNSPPILDRPVGYSASQGLGGKDLNIEVIFEFLCEGCAAEFGELQRFLDLPFLEGKVSDAVKIHYSLTSLPYKHGSWVILKLVPLLIDKCIALGIQENCSYFLKYTALSFDKQEDILNADELSETEMI